MTRSNILGLILSLNLGLVAHASTNCQAAKLNAREAAECQVRSEVQATVGQGGQDLIAAEPSDIAEFCPSYKRLGVGARAEFWTDFLVMVAAHESNLRPDVTNEENVHDNQGNPVISVGLFMISEESAQVYGCEDQNAVDLLDPVKNIKCGVKILSKLVSSGNIAGTPEKLEGGARYWEALRVPHLDVIKATLRENPYCSTFWSSIWSRI